MLVWVRVKNSELVRHWPIEAVWINDDVVQLLEVHSIPNGLELQYPLGSFVVCSRSETPRPNCLTASEPSREDNDKQRLGTFRMGRLLAKHADAPGFDRESASDALVEVVEEFYYHFNRDCWIAAGLWHAWIAEASSGYPGKHKGFTADDWPRLAREIAASLVEARPLPADSRLEAFSPELQRGRVFDTRLESPIVLVLAIALIVAIFGEPPTLHLVVKKPTPLLETLNDKQDRAPNAAAPMANEIGVDTTVEVVDQVVRDGHYLKVKLPDGRVGWIVYDASALRWTPK